MFDLFFNRNYKKLESLIMITKAELSEKITELSSIVTDEAGQVRSAMKSLEEVIVSLQAKIDANPEIDYSEEADMLAKVKSQIEGIYMPAVVSEA